MSHIHIDMQNVSFGYEKEQPILQQLSLHAGEHEAIGIIGANGVGKSTLLKLLVGLELGFSGHIRVEEIPRLEGISASRVRQLLRQGRLAELQPLVPETTYAYCRDHFGAGAACP